MTTYQAIAKLPVDMSTPPRAVKAAMAIAICGGEGKADPMYCYDCAEKFILAFLAARRDNP